MFHTGALLATSLAMCRVQAASLNWAGITFLIGIILFSGSLYFYSTTGIKSIAMVTPFGGVFFLIGWILFGYAMITFLYTYKSTTCMRQYEGFVKLKCRYIIYLYK